MFTKNTTAKKHINVSNIPLIIIIINYIIICITKLYICPSVELSYPAIIVCAQTEQAGG